MAELHETPRGNRLHIGLYGRRNCGKSTLFNRLIGQQVAVVSQVAGTTTDPVRKAMEIKGIGPVELMDTAGFDDVGLLGGLRTEKTQQTLELADMAVVVFDQGDCTPECEFAQGLLEKGVPTLAVIGKCDVRDPEEIRELTGCIIRKTGLTPIPLSAHNGEGMPALLSALVRQAPEGFGGASLCGHLVGAGETVLLVMPQDIQAPQGRLILPQVQTIRDLLDLHAIVLSCTLNEYPKALAALSAPPSLIITDSQVFHQVYRGKPEESRLTSFSVLMAGQKGDIDLFAQGARAMSALTERSRVLIAEACTHAPLAEDIGRVKIPRMLKETYGEGIQVDFVRGADFPKEPRQYDLIIQCGSCMMNRQQVSRRQQRCHSSGVPMTNYGLAIAYLTGIIDKVTL